MPGPWTDAHLDHLRGIGDPPADLVVAQLVRDDAERSVSEAWRTLRRSDDPVPAGLPPNLANFLQDLDELPPWADLDRIAAGEAFFAKHGPAIVTGLLCSSLPFAYSMARGAQVLEETGQMLRRVRARIEETAQLVFDVASPGGLAPGGRGLRTVQKVRLIHGVIRHHILLQPTWDTGWLGVPINQEDLAGTHLTFGYLTARAVEKLGNDVSEAEWDGWLHLWRVVAALLGVRDDALPDGREDAAALLDAIARRHQAPSAAGRDLTAALVEHINGYLPGRLWDGITAELMRLFLGDEVADWLGVPRKNWTRVLLALEKRLARDADAIADRSPLLQAVGGRFNAALLRALSFADRGGKRVRFRLPDSLQEALA